MAQVKISTKEKFSKHPHPVVKFGEDESNSAVVLCSKLQFNDDCMIIDNAVMERLLLTQEPVESAHEVAKELQARLENIKDLSLQDYVRVLQEEIEFYTPIISIAKFLYQRQVTKAESSSIKGNSEL